MLILNTNNFCLRTKQTAKPCTGYGHNKVYHKLSLYLSFSKLKVLKDIKPWVKY